MNQDDNTPPPSPCVNICALDIEDICIGCHRSAEEIGLWTQLSPAQKHEVMVRVREREEQHYL